jgi:hypothetical protein
MTQAVIASIFAGPKMAAPGDPWQWHQMTAQNAKKPFYSQLSRKKTCWRQCFLENGRYAF